MAETIGTIVDAGGQNLNVDDSITLGTFTSDSITQNAATVDTTVTPGTKAVENTGFKDAAGNSNSTVISETIPTGTASKAAQVIQLKNSKNEQLLPVTRSQIVQTKSGTGFAWAGQSVEYALEYLHIAYQNAYSSAEQYAKAAAELAQSNAIAYAKADIEYNVSLLDSSVTATSGQVLTSVTQTNGVLTAGTSASVNDLAYTASGAAKAGTLGEVIAEIHEALGTEGVVKTIATYISTLDSNKVGSGKFVTAVNEADGIVTVTYGSAYAGDVYYSNADENVTVKSYLDSLQAAVESVTAANSYTVVPETVTSDTLYGAWHLEDAKGNQCGATIYSYKAASAITNVSMGVSNDIFNSTTGKFTQATTPTSTETLHITYLTYTGKYGYVDAQLESFLQESEAGDGLIVDSTTHVMSVNIGNGLEFDSSNPKKVKVKATNGLEVTSDGVKAVVDGSTIYVNASNQLAAQISYTQGTNKIEEFTLDINSF